VTSCSSTANLADSLTSAPTQTATEIKQSTVTLTPTQEVPTETPTIEPTENVFDTGYNTIDFTQEPPQVTTEELPSGSEYIYRKAVVHLNMGDERDVQHYIDLDNLSDNDPSKSDLIFSVSSGSGTFYDMVPVNNAIFYGMDEKPEDLSTCRQHFSEMHFSDGLYMAQGNWVVTGYPYCVLTNEGHVAVVYLDTDSYMEPINGETFASLIVSVYKQKITTPIINTTPTEMPYYTPTLTPTNALTPLTPSEASLYGSGFWLSGDQLVILDTAIHNFQKWVGTGKKESVASMIVFPFGYFHDGHYQKVNNKEEFLANYDQIFPDWYAAGFANVSLEEGLFISWRGIALFPGKGGGGVWFTEKGYIYTLSN
jgi:hypothetical protein